MKAPKRYKVLHIISGLQLGGAELVMYRLLANQDPQIFNTAVVSLSDRGELAERIEGLGIPVFTLGARSGYFGLGHLLRLIRFVRDFSPDLIQTWMYHADLIGGIVGRIFVRTPVIWGLRHSSLDPLKDKWTTIVIARVLAILSRTLPVRIISCSKTASNTHRSIGYAHSRFTFIPNGYDLEIYKPDPVARARLRTELHLPDNTRLIGLPGRYHPQKDHKTFLEAAANLAAERQDVHFVLLGAGIDEQNIELMRLIEQVSLQSRVHLLGARSDLARIYPGFDLVTLTSSHGEAFPNVVAEAMACGVPVVATSVGDTQDIVGPTGVVVDPGDSKALSEAYQKLLSLDEIEREQLAASARQRIAALYSMARMVAAYQDEYIKVIEKYQGMD